MTGLSEPALDTAAARRAMIDSQLRPSGVNDPRLLARFAEVAREDFVPANVRAVAYMDRAVPVGNGAVLAPALTHGLMLSEARPTPADRVLVVDGGTGYLAALLAPLVKEMSVLAPADAAKPRGGPFSLLMIDGAVEQLPPGLAKVLDPEGRIVTGLVERGVTRLAVGRRAGDAVAFLTLGEADFAVLPGFAKPKTWSF